MSAPARYDGSGLAAAFSAGSGSSSQCPTRLPSLEQEFLRLAELTSADAPPSTETVSQASDLLQELLFRAVKIGLWISPHITSTHEGEIVMEWWKGKKKLTIYVIENEIEYIKVWGASIDSEMESGPVRRQWDITDIWHWITT